MNDETGSQLCTSHGMKRTVRIRRSHTARSRRRKTRIAANEREREAKVRERRNLIRFDSVARVEHSRKEQV